MQQREIKVRAWDRHTKTFIHFDLSRPIFDDTENSVTFECMDGVLGERDPEGNRFTLTQFVGLKDNNGKEIYEGDIVRGTTDEWDAETTIKDIKAVTWDKSDCGFTPFSEYDSDCGTYTRSEDVEVIGNIYENPDLLK